jgi:hypothetical protein
VRAIRVSVLVGAQMTLVYLFVCICCAQYTLDVLVGNSNLKTLRFFFPFEGFEARLNCLIKSHTIAVCLMFDIDGNVNDMTTLHITMNAANPFTLASSSALTNERDLLFGATFGTNTTLLQDIFNQVM